jgi:dynein regulatory complex protein 1
MRATYQLNTEKLDYNYRVLVERDHENQSTINQQKRKISRQRDMLLGLKQRYADSEKKYLEENMKLTDEYKRVTEQFKDLQSKFRHFEQVDTKKHAEVFSMKEQEVAQVVRQLLQADKVEDRQSLNAWGGSSVTECMPCQSS